MLKGRRRVVPLVGLETGDEERLLQTLSSFFGFNSFRDKQKDVCLNIMKPGSQTVALFPTGMGKSLCFQLPAVCLGGVSLVVSPLISLMQDQVAALQKLCAKTNGRVRCDFYAASAPDAEKKRIKALLSNARAEIVEQRKSYIVYVTPEFLDRNMALVKRLAQQEALTLVAIDEAHCVIEYGTDFRPDYLKLGQLAELGRSSVRVVALTASVSHQTLAEMLANLRMERAVQFRSSFNRANIAYEVHYTDTLADQGKDALDRQRFDLVGWIEDSAERRGQSGIVYVRKKTDCEEVAKRLSSAGVRAEAYHAAVADKAEVQQRWMRGETQVVVATTAFGMGIDKADGKLEHSLVHGRLLSNVGPRRPRRQAVLLAGLSRRGRTAHRQVPGQSAGSGQAGAGPGRDAAGKEDCGQDGPSAGGARLPEHAQVSPRHGAGLFRRNAARGRQLPVVRLLH